MSKKDKNVRIIYNTMVWKKSKLKSNEELMRDRIIKVDSDPRIAILIDEAEKPLPGNPIVVLGHGNGYNIANFYQLWDFQGTFCPHGISTCYIDFRGYGFSEGEYGTGATEPDDVITVINYLKKKGYEKISYFGYSLGATCGIYAAAEFPDLVCVVLDSPWLSTREWTEYKVAHFDKIGHDAFEQSLPAVYEQIKEKLGIDFNQIHEPREFAPKIKQPLFLIHGTADSIVPYSNSEELIGLVQSQEKIFKSDKFNHNDIFKRGFFWEEAEKFILKHNGIITDD